MKQKSHSGVKKRIKKTGSGKLMWEKSAKKHLLTGKSKRQKKLHPGGKPVSKSDAKNMAKLLAN
ncbi:50S ribosomal protein L35 [Candidatus Peregrinibacteria bacterium]|nr:50S ribosomal protein L35 [Candidatus Peregrinibacteria bacterium]